MPAASPFNPVLAAIVSIALAALAAYSNITLPLHYNSDPNDRLGLIARVVIIVICTAGCYRLCQATRGLGRAIPVMSLISIIGLVVNTVIWARG